MKKQILTAVLALTLGSICLAGCGSSTAESTDSTETAETADTTAETTEESDAEESAEPAEVSDDTTIASPITEYSSLQELNDTFGCRMCEPGVMGCEDISYTSINMGEDAAPIAQYEFSINGYEYMLRYCADYSASISGLYGADGYEAFSDPEAEGYTDFSCVYEGDFDAAHWQTVDGQYVFAILDNTDMDEETFETIAEEMQSLTIAEDAE